MTSEHETNGEQVLLRIEAGEYTEELKNYIFRELSAEDRKRIDWRGERSYAPGLAREPVTHAIIFVLNVNLPDVQAGVAIATASILAIASTIKHWMNLNAVRLTKDQTIKVALAHPELKDPVFDELRSYEKVLIENEDKLTPPKE
jgi:hypothetical protein